MGVGAVQLVARFAVERGHRVLDRAGRDDALRRRLHLGNDPRQLLLPPGIRLLEVDPCSEEVARVQLIPLLTDRIGLRRPREEALAEHPTELLVCAGRLGDPRTEVGAH